MLTEISVTVPNKAGKLLKVLEALNVVNIQAFSIEDAMDFSRIRMITNDPKAALYQLEKQGFEPEKRDIIGIALEHKPGQLLKVATNLGLNEINIEHGFLTLEMTKGRAIVLLRTSNEDKDKAIKILEQANFELCSEIEESLVALATPLVGKLDIHPNHDSSRLAHIIKTGESSYVEFKATMRWDETTHIVNKDLGKEVSVSIAAFMNSRGGTLLIGVNDDGTIRGLNHDFKTLGKKQNHDGFNNAFSDLVCHDESICVANTQFIDSYFLPIEQREVFVIEVSPSPNPVWINRGNDLYIRVGATDRRLNAREVVEYTRAHWRS